MHHKVAKDKPKRKKVKPKPKTKPKTKTQVKKGGSIFGKCSHIKKPKGPLMLDRRAPPSSQKMDEYYRAKAECKARSK